MGRQSEEWFIIGMAFPTFPDLLQRHTAYMKSNNVHMSKTDSRSMGEEYYDKVNKPYQRVTFKCFFGSTRKPQGVGIRKTKTVKSNCPSFLSIG